MGATPGAATALAKGTGVIVTVRVGPQAAAGCEAPPPDARAAEDFRLTKVRFILPERSGKLSVQKRSKKK